MKRILIMSAATLALAACAPKTPTAEKVEASSAPAAATVQNSAPAGTYKLDRAHTSVIFRVSHMGLSNWTGRFIRPDAELKFDPANPAGQSVDVTIDAKSLQTNYPEPEKLDFDAQIQKEFLDAAKYPTITFRSTKVEPTGPDTAKITGDFTLHGVTKPVVLEATFNGGYAPSAMDPSGSRIGFSAHGSFNRSDFGIGYGVPAPGSKIGVSDQVDVIIETEFTRLADAK